MPYRIAGIDVHKKKLAVVVADIEVEDEYQFERRWYGSNPEQLQLLAEWLIEQQVEEVVMESTAQYWKPVLERWSDTGSQSARSGKEQAGCREPYIWRKPCPIVGGAGARETFERPSGLVKWLVSQGLILSFVPDAEQRLWRTLTHTRYQRTRAKVRLQNQLEARLEEAHIKLSRLVSDLLGASARRMLKTLAEGETDPAALAALADQRLRARPAELREALGACTELNPVYRQLVKMALADLQLIEQQIGQLDQEIASLLREHQCGPTADRGPRAWGGFGPTDHCRSGCPGSGFRFRQESRLVGGGMSGRRRKRGREPQQTLAQGQPPDAPHSQSSRQCCRQTQREHLRDSLSSFGVAPRTQQNHWSDCASEIGRNHVASGCPINDLHLFAYTFLVTRFRVAFGKNRLFQHPRLKTYALAVPKLLSCSSSS